MINVLKRKVTIIHEVLLPVLHTSPVKSHHHGTLQVWLIGLGLGLGLDTSGLVNIPAYN